MRWRKATLVALLALTSLSLAGAARNLVRIAKNNAGAVAGITAARNLSLVASNKEERLKLEIASSQVVLRELEKQIPGEYLHVSEAGATLEQLAHESGLEVSRLDVDSVRDSVSILVVGSGGAAYRWLEEVEMVMLDNGVLLEQLAVAAAPAGRMEIAIELQCPTVAASLPHFDGLSSRQLRAATESWPEAGSVQEAFVVTDDLLAAGTRVSRHQVLDADAIQALSVRAFDIHEPDGSPELDTRGVSNADWRAEVLLPGRVVLVGTASIDGVAHYAFRFSEEQAVRTLRAGEQAFGWELMGPGDPDPILRKGGEYYAVPR